MDKGLEVSLARLEGKIDLLLHRQGTCDERAADHEKRLRHVETKVTKAAAVVGVVVAAASFVANKLIALLGLGGA